jgi:hypothetical protein
MKSLWLGFLHKSDMDELETGPKTSKKLWLGPYISIFIGEIFLSLSATELKSTK